MNNGACGQLDPAIRNVQPPLRNSEGAPATLGSRFHCRIMALF
ncbi:hypothetical protein [Paenibacillus sophorae]|nr:hypothetical protein [Paenibacillus sophorae]